MARKRLHVPGFPASSLNDEGWQGAWPDAIELSGVPGGFWENVAAHGLVVPAAWVDGPGWPALWSRAR